MSLSYDEIADILKIIDSSSCDELVLETPETRLVVRRRSAGSAPMAADARPSDAPPPSAPAASAPSRAAPAAASAGAEGLHVVRAPMVGTFYRAPSPADPPFVEVGRTVRKGDPLCLIEVMKLFTTIFAEVDGRVTGIGAENAAPVEYGQMLFTIDPAG